MSKNSNPYDPPEAYPEPELKANRSEPFQLNLSGPLGPLIGAAVAGAIAAGVALTDSFMTTSMAAIFVPSSAAVGYVAGWFLRRRDLKRNADKQGATNNTS